MLVRNKTKRLIIYSLVILTYSGTGTRTGTFKGDVARTRSCLYLLVEDDL